MIIKGTVHNGKIQIDVTGVLPEGTNVVVTQVDLDNNDSGKAYDLQCAKDRLRAIAELPSMGPDDGFSGADHDSVLYGNDS